MLVSVSLSPSQSSCIHLQDAQRHLQAAICNVKPCLCNLSSKLLKVQQHSRPQSQELPLLLLSQMKEFKILNTSGLSFSRRASGMNLAPDAMCSHVELRIPLQHF